VSHPGSVGDPLADRYEAALRELPEAYALALRLRHAGVPDATICQCLQIELEGLGMFITMAYQKLAAELDRTSASYLAQRPQPPTE
jgi:hypothetical protein